MCKTLKLLRQRLARLPRIESENQFDLEAECLWLGERWGEICKSTLFHLEGINVN